MQITNSTTVHQLLQAHPRLREWLIGYSPHFGKLGNPIVYNTVARAATIEAAASMADVPPEKLLGDILARIAEHPAPHGGTPDAGDAHDLDRARRQEALMGIIRRLHDGASVEEVKAGFEALVSGVDSTEIAAMEQALIAEGMPPEEVGALCDVHVAVFKEALEAERTPSLDASHPIAAYSRENVAAREAVTGLWGALADLEAAGDAEARAAALEAVRAGLDRLAPLGVHYTRKENQLFPVLEAHGIEGPTKVMWGIDDDIRERMKEAHSLASDPGAGAALPERLGELLRMVEDMIYKEEKILFPAALQAVPESEWAEMAEGDAEIGYAWDAAPAPGSGADDVRRAPGGGAGSLLSLKTGGLTPAQVDLMLRSVPFDLTFVAEDNRVAFYSEGDRVFPRSPAVIGREVRNCHPPSSVGRVEAILRAFKAGEKDVAEFWLELSGRFIHIRYFAMRDEAGEYRGCLEVAQDATQVRSLQGERRLLDW